MFPAPCSSSVVSLTFAKCVPNQSSSIVTAAGFAVRSATALRHFRINAPSAAACLVPDHTHPVQPVQQFPAEKPATACAKKKTKPSNSRREYEKHFQQFANKAALATYRPPAPRERAPAQVRKTVIEPPSAPLAATVSPSKFFMSGSLDFDDYIGKLLPAVCESQSRTSQNETVATSAMVTADAHVAKPKKKRQPPECAGVKRKLDLTKSRGETDSAWKTACGFADKFAESLSVRGLCSTAEADGAGNKRSADTRVLKKEYRVSMVLLGHITVLCRLQHVVIYVVALSVGLS